jgi:hypothetical protein
MRFIYDEELDTWLYGYPHNGIGIFVQDKKWYANVVYENEMIHLGPYKSQIEAQDAGIYEFNLYKNGE